jgi:ABC-type lipoprotein export system ATPase subunit
MGIRCEKLVKEFGEPPVRILHEIDMNIADREFVSITGRSGSGKSTLLYLLSTLDEPTSGTLRIDDRDPSTMSVDELHEFRNLNVGFVFQFHYLLAELTALENVLLPARNTGQHKAKEKEALALFEQFDIPGKVDKLPSQLSGGEQQRVAIARALIMKPRYLFADEPTGNLDSKNGRIVMDLLLSINRDLGTTIVMVTHEPDYAAMASREIFLADGRIVEKRDLETTESV